MSACFLRLHVCDVIQFRDDHGHAYQRPTVVIRAFERLRGRWYVRPMDRTSHLKATFVNIVTRFWRWKFRMRNLHPMDRMASILHISNGCYNSIVVCCSLLFSIFEGSVRALPGEYTRTPCPNRKAFLQTCRGVTSRLIFYLGFCVCSTNNAKDCKFVR